MLTNTRPAITQILIRYKNIQQRSGYHILSINIAILQHVAIYKYTINKISRTKSKILNVSRLGLQWSMCNILKPSVKWRMKMQLE